MFFLSLSAYRHKLHLLVSVYCCATLFGVCVMCVYIFPISLPAPIFLKRSGVTYLHYQQQEAVVIDDDNKVC